MRVIIIIFLSLYSLNFSQENSKENIENRIFNLLSKDQTDAAGNPLEKWMFEYSYKDLNGDGNTEILIKIENQATNVPIYIIDQKSLKILFEDTGYEFKVLNKKKRGYNVIQVLGRTSDLLGRFIYGNIEWDGKKYVFAK